MFLLNHRAVFQYAFGGASTLTLSPVLDPFARAANDDSKKRFFNALLHARAR